MGSPGLEAQPKPFPEGIANWEPQSGVTSLGAKQNSIPPNSWVPTGQRDGVKKAGSLGTIWNGRPSGPMIFLVTLASAPTINKKISNLGDLGRRESELVL